MASHPLFAALYDRLLAGAERAGLETMRRELVAQASGRVLELGAGTGHNLAHYGGAVTELVLTEPDRHMAARLRRRVAGGHASPPSVEVVEAPAERLPFDADRFDTVVSTLVLCTVDDLERTLAEVDRVLRSDGRFLYLEHVRSDDDPRLAQWQDRLERPWGWLAAGCHPNRATAEALAAAGFETDRHERGRLPKAPPWVRPLIRGSARSSA